MFMEFVSFCHSQIKIYAAKVSIQRTEMGIFRIRIGSWHKTEDRFPDRLCNKNKSVFVKPVFSLQWHICSVYHHSAIERDSVLMEHTQCTKVPASVSACMNSFHTKVLVRWCRKVSVLQHWHGLRNYLRVRFFSFYNKSQILLYSKINISHFL